jgi:hypothetical protein
MGVYRPQEIGGNRFAEHPPTAAASYRAIGPLPPPRATGKKAFRSMRPFMKHVAPKLCDLVGARDPDAVAA